MTCDGTIFGEERTRPDWTAAELEVLEAELEAARKRYILELKQKFPRDANVETNVRERTLRSEFRTELERRETEVYQAAHDRHFLRIIRQNVERVHIHHPQS